MSLAEQARKEQATETYGDAAQALVRYFQAQFGLDPNLQGEVDSDTAYKLNVLLEKHGAWPAPVESYVVFGRVADHNTGKTLSGLLVRAFDQDGFRATPLGETHSDAEGVYKITFPAAAYQNTPAERGGPDLILRAYDENGTEIGKSPLVNNASLSTELNLTATPGLWVVKGTVRQGEEPVVGAMVLVFDRDLRKRQLLGTDATDDQGRYSVTYQTSDFQRADRKQRPSPWLIVEVKTADGTSLSQEKRQGVTRIETIDLQLPGARPISEWERISAAVLPLLEGQGEGESDLLPEAMGPADIDFLEKETGEEGDRLRLWSSAYGAAQQEGSIPTWAYYAWFRMSLPTELKDLLARSQEELKKTLYDALIPNIINATSDELDKVIARIAELRLEFPLRPAKEGEAASLGDVLGTAGSDWLSEEKKKKYAEIADQIDPDADDFEEKTKALGLLPNEQNILQKTLRLGKLTQNHAPLMTALQGFVAEDEDTTLKGLVKLAEDQWIDLVYTHGVAGYISSPEEDALQLVQATEDRLPTASLLNKISTGAILTYQPGTESIQSFLNENPAFDIVKDNIEVSALDDEGKDLLKKLQNLKKVGVRWNDADAFLNRGITSLTQIVEYSPEQLKAILEEDVEHEQIAIVHAKAAVAQNVGIALMGYLQPLLYGVKAHVMQPLTETAQETGTELRSATTALPHLDDPNLRNLFGVLEQCACDPCLSVLSPAAYYADLLRFIDASGNAGGTLQVRRPDLYDLELSCDNAQIELPYIDLVLEVLENQAAFPHVISLPASVSISSQLSTTPIGEYVKNELKRTVEDESLENLTVEGGGWHFFPSPPHMRRVWVAKDRYRRWALSSTEERMAFYGENAVWGFIRRNSFDLNQFNILDLLAWLNSNNPNNKTIPEPSLKRVFEDVLLEKKLVPGNLVYSVSKVEDFHWKIEYEIITNVITEISSGQSFIIMGNTDGTRLTSKEYGKKTVEATASQLDKGKTPRILKSDIDGKYTTVKSKERASDSSDSIGSTHVIKNYITSTKKTIHLFYNPAHLYIQGLTYQSTKADKNLFAQPQNRNPLAYEKLALTSAVYPWTLPYDQPLTETRLLLEKVGISRLKLIDLIIAEDKAFSKSIWAKEILGLSQDQLTVITTPTSAHPLYLAWGLNKRADGQYTVADSFQGGKPQVNTGLNLLKQVSILMQQARINHNELQNLMQSRYINRDNSSIPPNQDCNPTQMEVKNANDGFFDRLHRFIRLWRVLGWSITQVDQALMAKGIGNDDLNDNGTLIRIAQIKALHQQLGLPLDVLIALFAPFSNHKTKSFTSSGKAIETRSMYEQVFQNILLQNPPNKDLAFDPKNEQGVSIARKKWEELLPSIAAALGIRQPDLAHFLASGIADFSAIALNSTATLEGLNAIWRNTTLAKELSLNLEEYAAACRLIYATSSPFAEPIHLLKFVQEIGFVQQTGIELKDLEQILCRDEVQEKTLLPTETADDILKGLQQELRQITDLNFGNFRLSTSKLSAEPFLIKNTWETTDRWKYWQLSPVQGTDKWSVADPSDPSRKIEDLPLTLLQQEAVLIQQINLLFPARPLTSGDLPELLKTSFVSPNGPDELDTSSTPGIIENLSPAHLDRLVRFIALKNSIDLPVPGLDLLIKTVAASGNEPLEYDLAVLIKMYQHITLKQWDAIINYFARLYKQEFKITQELISKIHISILSADTTSRLPKIIYALRFFSSFDFWEKKQVSTTDPNAYKIVAKLHKFFLLNEYWKATPQQVQWLGSWAMPIDSTFAGLKPDDLIASSEAISYSDWKRTTLLFKTAQTSAEMETVLAKYLKALTPDDDTNTSDDDTKITAANTVLSEAFGVTIEDLDHGANLVEMTSISDYFDPLKLCRLLEYLSTLQKLGLNNTQYSTLVSEPTTTESIRIARQILLARYGAHNYADALKEVNDRLRPQQRDVLVDFLIWRDQVQDADDLYKKYLIDVEMSACMRTTRLLQSTAAAQLFVHRCLLNLELDVNPKSFDKKRWEWTKNYRVWEANRKVFLYPENWLYPELRDDKTAAFKSFETELSQNEASDENAKNALIDYAEELVELSKITVLGMHEYEISHVLDDKDVTERRLFQVGRTINPPYRFYWRQAFNYGSDGMRWTGWEKIEQDLSADHVVPFTYGGDLCIAWPVISTKEDAQKKTWYEVELAWTRRTNKGWTERKRSSDKFEVEKLFARDEKSMFLLRLKDQKQEAEIELYIAQTPAGLQKESTISILDKGLRYVANEVPLNEASLEISFICQKQYSGSYRTEGISSGAEVYIMGMFVLDGQSKDYNDYADNKYKPQRDIDGSINYLSSYYILSSNKSGQSDNLANSTKTIKIYFYDHDNPSARNPAWHYFDLEANWSDQPAITKLSLGPIIKGHHHELTWDIIFDGGAETNEQEIQRAATAALSMEKKGVFKLFGNKDGEWDEQNLTPPLALEPSANTYFFSSGLKEQNPGSYPIKLLGTNDITSTPQPEKYFAIRSSKSNSGSTRAWQIEEGDAKLLVNVSGNGSALSVPTILTAYPEAKTIKSKTSFDLLELFDLQKNTLFESGSFGHDKLMNYNNGSAFTIVQDPEDLPLPFNLSMPYALYNWEVFYHLPLAAAYYFSKQHRFEEARQWFHYIFDPTSNEENPGRKRFWRFLPFRNNNETDSVSKLLNALSDPNGTKKVQPQIDAWLADPFSPFAVARLRINAFEWFTVTSYIKNLIEWGDQLFRRDTRESINEATLLYVMASDILGRRPMPIRSEAKTTDPLSYRALKERGLDGFGNTWIKLIDTPLGKQMLSDLSGEQEKYSKNIFAYGEYSLQISRLSSIGSTYFCVPPNEKILELWDTVADRLFKIRNCQNIEGITRNLPLLDPPIDPELLIRAKLAGVSVADAMSDLYAPPPLYRFNVWIQKAIDLCNEVKGLGAAILSAIEKKEAEHLSLLRSSQEIDMQKLVTAVREEQINEAGANIEALEKSKENIISRVIYLQRQMGGTETTLDADGVPVVSESYIGQPAESLELDFKGLGLTKPEVDQITFMQTNNIFNLIGGGLHTASGLAHTIASKYPSANPPLDTPKKTAESLGHAFSALGTGFNTVASHYSMLERRSGMIAGWQRRRDEWLYQAKTAVAEIRQIDKQIIASEIRRAIAQKELDNHRKQIEHTKTLDDYVRTQKFSRETLYVWMESQLSLMYKAAFNLAFDQAKKAEKVFRFELGLAEDSTSFITAGYWDTLHRGLLAGEGLSQDLKRMDIAYLDRNRRELELTKHISLNQLNPFALLQLHETGTCDFSIPEELFDLDFPGHYFRRIKSVSISIPCVAGPYTTISATLRLKTSSIRAKANLTDALVNNFAAIQSIATSSAQNDGGLFELNFRDERYLPFEYSGAISEWRLEMMESKKLRQFDYNTISDVIVHLRYTAREDGGLKTAAVTHLNGLTNALGGVPLQRLFSLRHDFPNEWHAWKNEGQQPLNITLEKHHFPYFAQWGTLAVKDVKAYKREGEKIDFASPEIFTFNAFALTPPTPFSSTPDDWFLLVSYQI
ncbi:MAG: neuraminidase-like domain-containing protein [Bacteroidia bacterium]|nr:neuraminidase-like domain-containing protein [Bacteroidia bacterium]